MFKESYKPPKKTIKVDIPKEAESVFKKLTDFQVHGLQSQVEVFQIQNKLMKNEYTRLQKRYGVNHIRTQQMKSQIETEEDTISQLNQAIQIAKISVPKVPTGCTIIHGQILNKQKEPGFESSRRRPRAVTSRRCSSVSPWPSSSMVMVSN